MKMTKYFMLAMLLLITLVAGSAERGLRVSAGAGGVERMLVRTQYSCDGMVSCPKGLVCVRGIC